MTTENPVAPKPVTIDGIRFQIRPWTFDEGTRWGFRLFALFVATLGRHTSNMAAAAALVTQVTEDEFVALRTTCVKHTELLVDEAGVTKAVPINPDVHLRGRLIVVVALMRAHVELNFSDFFERASEVFDPARDEKAS